MTKAQANANKLYAHFVENAEKRVVNKQTVNVWTGKLTDACRKVGIPKGTESRVTAPMEQIGCIQILHRGVRNYPTVIALIKPPTEEMWAGIEKGLTSQPDYATLRRQVEEMQRRLGGVDLAEALINIERRLTALEQKSAVSP